MTSDPKPADTVDEAAESAQSAASPAAEDGSRRTSPATSKKLFIGAAALAGAAFIAAVVFGVWWIVASSGDDAEFANSRDEVAKEGASAIKAFTELDYTKPDEFFDRSVSVSTGDIRDQVQQSREQNKKIMIDAKSAANTKVLDVAVDELNEREGKARFLASIQVTVKQGEQSSVKPLRLEVQMTRVDEDGEQSWKLSGIDPVPVVGPAK